MRPDGRRKGNTKQHLLEAAGEVFAEKGFRDATIADICEKADANIAAVNYHFGGKEALYVEAWRLSFHRSLQAHPPDGGVSPDAPAKDRLRAHIHSIVQRITDPDGHEFEIIQKEHANPTGLLVEVMRESIQPIRRRMRRIVRELLGERASDRQVQLCQMSIMAQCLHTMMRQRHHKMVSEGQPMPGPPFLQFGVEVITDHIVRFSLAGIREMRRQIDNGEHDDR